MNASILGTRNNRITASVRQNSKTIAGLQLFTIACAFLFASSYVLRVTLIFYLGGPFLTSLIQQIILVLLPLSFVCVLLGGIGRPLFLGGLIFFATAASLWGCIRLDFALPRWTGWVVIFSMVGPCINTRQAKKFREILLSFLQKYALLITLLSALWVVVGLPNMGPGDFSGVMWHSLTLAPIVAMVGVYALIKAVNTSLGRWHALYFLTVMLILVTASRSSLVALLLASLVTVALKAKRSPLVIVLIVSFFIPVITMPNEVLSGLNTIVPNSLISGLIRKEFNHSREGHWEARWDEFRSSPWLGIGFSTSEEGSVGFNEESGAVETGSSYLAILSMTGIAGVSAFLFLVISLMSKTIAVWRYLSGQQQMEICGFACFWFVHLGAEGYIYAVGSLFCLAFWLWVGHLNDKLDELKKLHVGKSRVSSRLKKQPVLL